MTGTSEPPLPDSGLPERLLAERHFVEALVARLVGPGADADDVVQATWLRALRTRTAGEARSPQAWLSRVVRSVVADRCRAARRRAERETAVLAPVPPPTPDEVLEREERRREVVAAVLALPDQSRDLLLMRHWQDLEPVEIARRLGLPSATVRSRLHRARELLRGELDRRYGDRRTWLVALAPLAGPMPSVAVPAVAGVLGVSVMLAKFAAALVAVTLLWLLVRGGMVPDFGDDAGEVEPGGIVQATGGDGGASNGTEVPPTSAVVADRTRMVVATGGSFVVTGRVRDRDGPVAGLAVELRFVDPGARAPDAATESVWQLISDDVGRVQWRGDAPRVDGVFELRPAEPQEARGFAWTAHVVGRAPEPIDLRVTRLDRVVTGTVRDSGGRPIPGASVRRDSFDGVVTDRDGRYRLRVAGGGTCTLVACAEGFVMRREVVELGLDDAELQVDFALRPGKRVAGVVVDPLGRPVVDARVHEVSSGPSEARSDVRGGFVLSWIDPDASGLLVVAEHDGFDSGRARARVGDEDVRIEMAPSGSLRGRAVDADGAPVRGAAVFVRTAALNNVEPDAFTDAAGRFVVRDLRLGTWPVAVVARGHAIGTARAEAREGGGTEIEVRLGRAAPIIGRVVDDRGAPISDASVLFTVAGAEGMDGIVRDARTDDAGVFAITELPVDPVDVSAIAAGHHRSRLTGIEPGGPPIELRLARHATLAGRVVDADSGAPIESFVVRFVPGRLEAGDAELGSYAASWEVGHRFAGSDGLWRAQEELSPGEVTGIEVRAPGYAIGRLLRVVAAFDPDPVAATVRLERGEEVRGVVIADAPGRDVAGTRVHLLLGPEALWQVGRGMLPVARADAGGRFSFDERVVAEDPFWVYAESADGAVRLEGPFRGDAGVIRVAVGGAAVVAGRLLHGAAGVPVDLVPVDVAGLVEPMRRAVDEVGQFRFEGVPPGGYELRFGHPTDGTWVRRRVFVSGSGVEAVELVADDGVRELALEFAGAAPPSSWAIAPETAAESPEMAVREMGSGRAASARVEGLAAIRYRVTAVVGGQTLERLVDLAAGDVRLRLDMPR